METAKANGCEPYAHLRELFENCPLPAPALTVALLLSARPPVVTALDLDTWVRTRLFFLTHSTHLLSA